MNIINEILHKINYVRYNSVLKDPFPEHSYYKRYKSPTDKVYKFFGQKGGLEKPKDISIWEAYQKGYDQAYKEISEKLPHELKKIL